MYTLGNDGVWQKEWYISCLIALKVFFKPMAIENTSVDLPTQGQSVHDPGVDDLREGLLQLNYSWYHLLYKGLFEELKGLYW